MANFFTNIVKKDDYEMFNQTYRYNPNALKYNLTQHLTKK